VYKRQIPYIPIENFQITLLEQLHDAVPENFYILLSSTITDIVSRQQGGLLSLGFLLALYFASNGFLGLIVAFNNTAHSIETRNVVQQYFISIVLMIIISLLVIVSTALILIGTGALNYLVRHDMLNGEFVIFVIKFGKWLVVLLLIFFAISFMYFLAPAKKQRFRFISAGGTLATLLFIATTLGFNYYVDNFAQYNALYGSIGTIIVIMMWLYLNSISLLVGFELNASISSAKKSLAKEVYLKSL
jgi:membrane protein